MISRIQGFSSAFSSRVIMTPSVQKNFHNEPAIQDMVEKLHNNGKYDSVYFIADEKINTFGGSMNYRIEVLKPDGRAFKSRSVTPWDLYDEYISIDNERGCMEIL